MARSVFRSAGMTLALFGLYVVVGRLSLTLALVPGYATPVYFPAGVGLAALLLLGWRAVPAVVLGAIALPLWNQLSGSAGGGLGPALEVAAMVATGVTLQTCVRALLIKRFVGAPSALTRTREVVTFLAIAGPIGCLISPTWSVTGLYVAGQVEKAGLAYAWLNWWAGDTIASLTVVPIAYCVFASPRAVWRRRRLVVGAPLAVALALTVFVTYRLRIAERTQVSESFRAKSESLVASFEVGLERYIDLLRVLAGHIAHDPAMDAASFHEIAGMLLPLYPGLRALASAERFYGGETRAPPPGCAERTPGGTLGPCGRRAFYDIVKYIEPRKGNEPALNYDLSSESRRAAALAATLATGRPTATSLLALVQGSAEQPGLLIAQVVRNRRGEPLRFANGVFNSRDMVASVLAPFDLTEMGLVIGIRTVDGVRPVYTASPAHGGKTDERYRIRLEAKVSSADGLAFEVSAAPSSTYVAARSTMGSSFLVLGLVAFMSTLAAYLLVLSGRNEELLVEVEERLRAERELRHAKEAAEAASRAKSGFLATVSHEIRTPLGAVLGFSELLSTGELTVDERDKAAGIIRRSGELLSRVINDILDFSKVEAGRLEVECGPVGIGELLSDVAGLLAGAARAKGLRLEIDASEVADRVVWTDGMRLRQVLLNVVGNAVKFTSAGEVRLHARRETGDDGRERIAFLVSDTGIGVDAVQAASLFQPFAQADASHARRFGGTGLGLILSRSIARALGGDLTLVESAPGRGSTFKATVAPGEARVGDGAAPADVGSGARTVGRPLRGRRILVVEDGKENQLLVGRYLEADGAAVDFADNGAEGMIKALEGRYDAVLMDIAMPVMDGYEATAALRRKGFRTPIVALTAHALPDDVARCLEKGFDAHLAKPIDRRRMAAVTASAIHAAASAAGATASAPG